MSRRTILTLACYVAFCASLATPLYEPLSSGRDQSWVVVVALAAAHLAAGIALADAFAVALPFGLVGIGLLVNGGGGDSGTLAVVLVIELPALALLTAIGCAIGRWILKGRRGAFAAAALFAVTLWPAAWAALEWSQRGAHVSPAVQAALPATVSLGNLCPRSETDRAQLRDIRRRAETLLRELRRRPHDLVTYTYYFEDGPDERRDITIRELAEEQLHSLDENGPDCDAGVVRRLRAAL